MHSSHALTLRIVVQQGQGDKALAVLLRLHEFGDQENNLSYAQREYDQMERQLEIDKLSPTSWASIFSVPSYRKRAITGFATMFLAQCTGTQIINSKS
jgi:hypothetical protein